MKAALFANANKHQAQEVLHDLSHFLCEHGVDVVVEYTDCFSSKNEKEILSKLKSCAFIVSIGGDGSILHLIQRIGIPAVPVVGVNLGSLGFLADISVANLFSDFERICKKKFDITERLVIEGFQHEKCTGFAINEITVHRGCCQHIIDLSIHVDGCFLNTFSADGLIISTPGGSTAYSLAANGPIIAPEINALVLNPICPHTLSNRPIVIQPKESIAVELLRGAESVDIAYDGQPPHTLKQGEPLLIHVSEKHFRLIHTPSSNYFATLRTKLGWTGSLRNA